MRSAVASTDSPCMSTVQLNDGVEIPILGLKVVMNAPSTDAIKGAYSEVHIRHINFDEKKDPFWGSREENRDLSTLDDLGIKREEVFITIHCGFIWLRRVERGSWEKLIDMYSA
jgi:hypothetical protein